MSDQPIEFGDNVRVLSTPDTESLGIAGLIGSVHGHTVPSVTGVDVVGAVTDDFAFNVHFDELDKDYWFAPQLLEFVDHGAGSEFTLGGVPKKWTRNVDGSWDESDTNTGGPPKRGFFSRLFGR